MNISKKSLVYLGVVLLLISLLANMYSFSKMNTYSTDNNEKIKIYQSSLSDSEKEIDSLNKQLEELKTSNSDDKKEIVTEGNFSKPDEVNTSNEEMVNSAERFIEYAFNSSPETYVTRKKNASNYMTDSLIDTLFSSDGIDEQAQKINTSVDNLVVYVNQKSQDECIVYYKLAMEIITSGYKEENDNYIKLQFVEANGKYKVSEIEAINIIGGV